MSEQVASIWLTCVVYLTSVCNASLKFSVGASTLSLVYVSHTFVKTFTGKQTFILEQCVAITFQPSAINFRPFFSHFQMSWVA